MNKTSIAGLKVDDTLFNFINQEVIPGTEIDKDIFWREFSEVVHNLNPKNKEEYLSPTGYKQFAMQTKKIIMIII